MTALDWVTAALLTLGCFVALTSAVGVLRMPDFFSRIHPAGKSDTLAQMVILSALVLQALEGHHWQAAIKLALISTFLLFTTPASTHAIARAAWVDGRRPWRRPADDPAPALPPAHEERAS